MKQIIGRIDPADRHVVIWGAGFSGLIIGYYLKAQGYRITIYEKSNRAGGKIHTKKTSYGLVEKAANALYVNQDVLDLLKELNLGPLPATKKLKRLLMVNKRPRSPLQIGTFSKVVLNAHKKPPLITDGLTVAEFFKPLLGKENIDKLLSPVLGGLYAAPAEQLHFRSIFHQVGKKAQFNTYWEFIKLMMKAQKEAPKTEIAGSISFEGGMQTLIDRLTEVLRPDIKLNYKENFRLKHNTIICTDAHNASELLRELKPQLSLELSRIKYKSLTSVTVFIKREIRSLQKSFGVLIPLNHGFKAVGILNNKAIFPSNNENVQSYTFIGPDDMSEETVMSDLKLLNSDIEKEDVDHMEFSRWEKGLPVYDLQRYLAVRKLHQLAQSESKLAIFGNYVAGISLREMVSLAKAFAKNPQMSLEE